MLQISKQFRLVHPSLFMLCCLSDFFAHKNNLRIKRICASKEFAHQKNLRINVMVTILASHGADRAGVRFTAAAGRPVTRLYLVQPRLEMHTPWLVGLTPLQLVK